MYIELDGDDVAVTYIKDIVFNTNRQDVEVLRMAKVLSQSLSFFAYIALQCVVCMSPHKSEKILSEYWNLASHCSSASICYGQMDHWNPAEPASGLHGQL